MARILIYGGDKRQFMLSGMLKERGHSVALQGFEKLGAQSEQIEQPDYVFLPVPYCNPDGTLKAPFSGETMTLETVVHKYPHSAYIMGGCDAASQALMGKLHTLDLLQNEGFLLRNALLTAQATICAYAKQAEIALCDTRCVVVGYGRISKFLCRLLMAHGASLTVTARKNSDLALIEAENMTAVRTRDLGIALSDADVIINTVPVNVFGLEELREIRPGTTFIELASPPYGVNLKLAEACGVDVRIEAGLPGRYFPVSAARAILHVFEREELS